MSIYSGQRARVDLKPLQTPFLSGPVPEPDFLVSLVREANVFFVGGIREKNEY